MVDPVTVERLGMEALKVAALAIPRIASWVNAAAATGDTVAHRCAAILPQQSASRAAAEALKGSQ